jgi:hypothetical protein
MSVYKMVTSAMLETSFNQDLKSSAELVTFNATSFAIKTKERHVVAGD